MSSWFWKYAGSGLMSCSFSWTDKRVRLSIPLKRFWCRVVSWFPLRCSALKLDNLLNMLVVVPSVAVAGSGSDVI